MSLFPPEEKPKTNWPLILGLCVAAGGAYYMFVHIPRPRRVTLAGPDDNINGVFELSNDTTVTRKHLADAGLANPTGEWSDQVWKHVSKDNCYIYDHNVTNGNHTWCIGPWNATDGGAIHKARYAYIYVEKKHIDTKVANYKKSQTWGVDIGRSLNPLQSWDVMQFGWFHNGWSWTAESQKTTGTVKLKAE